MTLNYCHFQSNLTQANFNLTWVNCGRCAWQAHSGLWEAFQQFLAAVRGSLQSPLAVPAHGLPEPQPCQSHTWPQLRLQTKTFLGYEEARRLHWVTKTALGLESKPKICMSGNSFWHGHDLQTSRIICWICIGWAVPVLFICPDLDQTQGDFLAAHFTQSNNKYWLKGKHVEKTSLRRQQANDCKWGFLCITLSQHCSSAN